MVKHRIVVLTGGSPTFVLALGGVHYPFLSCNGPDGPKGPKFKQNKQTNKTNVVVLQYPQEKFSGTIILFMKNMYGVLGIHAPGLFSI